MDKLELAKLKEKKLEELKYQTGNLTYVIECLKAFAFISNDPEHIRDETDRLKYIRWLVEHLEDEEGATTFGIGTYQLDDEEMPF